MKPSQVITALKTMYAMKRPTFLWGAPGIGKSDVVRAVAEQLGIQIVDKRLAQCDPTELKGYPVPDLKKGVMRFLHDTGLPTDGKGILFLDELPHAPNAVQSVAFQLALDRKIGDYTLPEGWVVVAAGNRTTDRAGAHTINAALANRFVHIDMNVETEDWIDWAMNNGVSDLTRGYIRYRPQNLMTNEIKPGAREFPTPRTWAFADQIVQRTDIEDSIKLELIKGTVGEGLAAEYIGYYRNQKNLVNLDRIMVSPESAPLPEGPSAVYAVIAALESRTSGNNLDRLMKYIKRLDKEFQTVYVESITRNKGDDVTDTVAYIDWVRENREMLA